MRACIVSGDTSLGPCEFMLEAEGDEHGGERGRRRRLVWQAKSQRGIERRTRAKRYGSKLSIRC
jgi:hypothetical protein